VAVQKADVVGMITSKGSVLTLRLPGGAHT
jgi:hypothetical protein